MSVYLPILGATVPPEAYERIMDKPFHPAQVAVWRDSSDPFQDSMIPIQHKPWKPYDDTLEVRTEVMLERTRIRGMERGNARRKKLPRPEKSKFGETYTVTFPDGCDFGPLLKIAQTHIGITVTEAENGRAVVVSHWPSEKLGQALRKVYKCRFRVESKG